MVETQEGADRRQRPRCERCGKRPRGRHHDAHEVWKYVDANDTGLDLESVRKLINEWRADVEKAHQEIVAETLARHPIGVTMEFQPIEWDKPLSRILIDIKLLCRDCHIDEHWESGVWRPVLTAHYSGFDKLPEYHAERHVRGFLA
jgi:hypothetical protein